MARPDLNLLVTLDVLLAEGSVARAARRLRLSPSAMSRALARLRAATGDPLLVRAGRGLVPTPRALALREPVGRLVQESEAVLRPAETLDLARLARTFTLRTRDGFVENFGPALLARVGKAAPGIRLRFVPKPDRDSAPLRDGSVDLETGVVGEATGPELRAQALFPDRLIGVVRRGHALSRGRVTPQRYAAGAHIQVSRRGLDRARRRPGRPRAGAHGRHGGGWFRGGPGARPLLRPDRQRARASYRQSARGPAQLSSAGRDAGDHGVVAVAPAHGRRPRTPLAARLRARRLRREEGPLVAPQQTD